MDDANDVEEGEGKPGEVKPDGDPAEERETVANSSGDNDSKDFGVGGPSFTVDVPEAAERCEATERLRCAVGVWRERLPPW